MIKAQDAITYARSMIGTPYGDGPGELDCINLIKAIIRNCQGGQKDYTTAGTSTLWESWNLLGKYKHLTWRQESTANATPGMLAFKGKPWGCAGQPHHVGIVTEAGTVVHASSEYHKVVETVLDASWTLLARHRYIETIYAKDELMPDQLDEGVDITMDAPYDAVVQAETGDTVFLRPGPGTGYQWTDRVPINADVRVIKNYGDWAYVNWSGKPGYMMTKFLREKEEPAAGLEAPEWMEDPYIVSESGAYIKLCGRWRLSRD